MARRSTTEVARSRAETLAAAVQVASVVGLEGLTIGRLADQLQMSKSGLVGRFGSKQQLQLAALEAAADTFRRSVYEPAAGEPAGLRRLNAICDAWVAYLQRPPFPGGCFLTTASVEFDARRGPVNDAVKRVMRQWLGLLQREAQTALANGELPRDGDAKDVAFTINALGVGANCDFQLHRERDALLRARRAMAVVLGMAAAPGDAKATRAAARRRARARPRSPVRPSPEERRRAGARSPGPSARQSGS
jgi:AcrR family transcriptional regulator